MSTRGIHTAEQGITDRHGLNAPLYTATSTASLYLPELQPFISLRRKLSAHYTRSHAGGGSVPSDALLMAAAVALTEGHGGHSLENCNLANRSSLNTTSWMSACQWHKKSSIVWSGLGKQCKRTPRRMNDSSGGDTWHFGRQLRVLLIPYLLHYSYYPTSSIRVPHHNRRK